MSRLLFIRYRELENWSVKSYLNSNLLQSQFELVFLGKLIKIRQEKIKKNDYKNDIDLVKKISFKDGKIHLREERKTGMDLYNVYPNDLLVSKINFHQGALSINESSNNLLSSTHYQPYIVNKNKVDLKFLTLALRSKQFQNAMAVIKSEGIKTEATSDFIKSLKIPLPSLKTQQKLVKNYQDKLNLAKKQNQLAKQKEAEIETYFYQELGIELPKEEKQDKKPLLQFIQFKDLKEWGYLYAIKNNNTIISKYRVLSINDLCQVSSGGTPSRSVKEYYENGYIPWIKTGELNNSIIRTTEEKITKKAIKNSSAKLYPINSIIIAMYGATIGQTAKLGIEATTNQACAVLFNIKNDLISNDFIWEFMQTQKEKLKKLAYGSAQPNLNARMILDYKIPLPPLQTQNKIVKHIQSIKDEIKSLKQQAEQNQKDALNEFEREVFNET